MVYVEWLRVRGALKWTVIVLGILFLITAVVRVAVIGVEHNVMARVARMASDKGSRITESTTADGAHRTVIDDPHAQSHVVIDDYGWGRKHIVIVDRSSHDHDKETVVAGSVHVSTLPTGQGSITEIDTDGSVGFGTYAAGGMIVALILATILGAPFARENDGHLEIALTKPIDRLSLGLWTIAVDALGLVAAFVAGIVFMLLCNVLFEFPHITFDLQDFLAVGLGIAGPLAWYAMLNATTAWMRRGYGAVVGLAWPVAIIVILLTFVPPDGNIALVVIRDVFNVVAKIDPLAYMHISSGAPSAINGVPVPPDPVAMRVGVLALHALVYSTIALLAWRRVEA